MTILEKLDVAFTPHFRRQHGSSSADSVSPLLKQHEQMLIDHVEATIRQETLAAIGEEAQALRTQLQARLTALESEMYRLVEAFLISTRQQFFTRIAEETDKVISGWSSKLRDDLGSPRPAEPQTQLLATLVDLRPEPPPESEDKVMPVPAGDVTQAESAAEQHSEDDDLYESEVSLVIGPPVNLTSLMALCRSLWGMQNLSVVQALGSDNGGVVLELRLARPTALRKALMQTLYAANVHEASHSANGNGRRTIGMSLKSPTEEIMDNGES